MAQHDSGRPLSPHLSVYKPQITSMMSIFHRITGFALSVGAVVLAGWLWALAYSPSCLEWLSQIFAAWYGKLLLAGWSFAFYYHLGNGVRHLCWDMGKGFDIPSVYRSGYAVLLFAAGLTAITWYEVWVRVGL